MRDLTLLKQMAGSAFSACVAETLSIPFDTIKVRLQMNASAENKKGLIETALKVYKTEGVSTFYNGLTAGLVRQLFFSGIRVGSYDSIKHLVCGPLEPGQTSTLPQKIAAAMISGTIGITIANPADVVKVRLQNQNKAALSEAASTNKIRYTGTFDCFYKIWSNEGIRGLWTSWSANVMRNSIINAAEIASYDYYKEQLIQRQILEEGTSQVIACASGAAFTAAVFGSPLDLVTTRHMNHPGKYKNPVDCILSVVRNEGFSALYKGFIPNVIRLSSYNVVFWICFENIKKAYINDNKE